jgi:hypothetical protein
MGHRSSVLTMSAIALLGLAVGARAELIDPPPPQDTLQEAVKGAHAAAVPAPRPRPVAFHHAAVSRPLVASLSPPPTCLICNKYLLIVGIGF